jgi:Tfp pilus assembly protein PilF
VLKKLPALLCGMLVVLVFSFPCSGEIGRAAELSRLRNIGRAHYEEEKYDEAVKQFEGCLKLSPDSAMDHINLGIVLAALGRHDEARAHLAKGEKLDASLSPYAAYNRAIMYKREKKFAEAAREFERMRELDPNCPDTAYNLAVVYESLNELEKAFAELTRAVELAPDEIGPHYRRMLIAARLRKMDVAAEERKVFLELRAGDSRTRTPEELEMSRYTEIIEPERTSPELRTPAVENPLAVNFKDVTIETGLRTEAGGAEVYTRQPFCWADVDGDPRLDLLVVTGSAKKPLEMWRNRGNGAFQEASAEVGLPEVKGRLLAVACGDLDHDGDDELCLSDDAGIHILFKKFGHPPQESLLAGGQKAVELLLIDFDHDGDLDLYAAFESSPSRMYRNNGKGEFELVPEESGLSGNGSPASLLRFIDFDDDNDVDFFLTHAEKPNELLSSMRMGRFKDVVEKIGVAQPANPRNVAVADMNNDGWSDIVLLTGDGEVLAFLGKRLGKFERIVLGKVENDGSALAVFDYDNDGDEDLFVTGRLFQNDGGTFTDVSDSVGFDVKDPDDLVQASAEDYDEDGDLDIAVCYRDGGIVLLRNDGGNKNNWIRVALEGLQSNRFGVSTKIEVRDGAFYQKKISLGRPLLFGVGERRSLDVLRLWWPTGVAQNVLSPKVCETANVLEKLGPPSSCPFVYTWDGEKFSFLTDVLDGGALGVPLGNGTFWTYRNKEDLLIPGARLRPKDGMLEVRLTSELRELVYLDSARLTAMDHSPECSVYPDECVGPPGTGETRIHSITRLRPPESVRDDRGHDLRDVLSEVDGQHADTFALTRFHGIAEAHSLLLDFGDTSTMKQPVLILTGWIEWSDGDTLFALGQGAGPAPFGPALEMQKEDGSWEKISDSIGVPAGIGKNVVVELPRALCGKSTRLRIATNFEIYWDRIAVGDAAESPPAKSFRLTLLGADLHFRGFSRLVRGERGKPPWYDYSEVSPEAPWQPQQGLLTRYGDVLPLLNTADDRLVVFGPGDELTLMFSLPPELPSGLERDFILRLDGWIKDGNSSTYTGDSIEPLPYHAMKSYPPVAEKGIMDDPSYAEYLLKYNTRPLRRDNATLRWRGASAR